MSVSGDIPRNRGLLRRMAIDPATFPLVLIIGGVFATAGYFAGQRVGTAGREHKFVDPTHPLLNKASLPSSSERFEKYNDRSDADNLNPMRQEEVKVNLPVESISNVPVEKRSLSNK